MQRQKSKVFVALAVLCFLGGLASLAIAYFLSFYLTPTAENIADAEKGKLWLIQGIVLLAICAFLTIYTKGRKKRSRTLQ